MRFSRNPISNIRSKAARFLLIILPLAVAFVIAATVKPILVELARRAISRISAGRFQLKAFNNGSSQRRAWVLSSGLMMDPTVTTMWTYRMSRDGGRRTVSSR